MKKSSLNYSKGNARNYKPIVFYYHETIFCIDPRNPHLGRVTVAGLLPVAEWVDWLRQPGSLEAERWLGLSKDPRVVFVDWDHSTGGTPFPRHSTGRDWNWQRHLRI